MRSIKSYGVVSCWQEHKMLVHAEHTRQREEKQLHKNIERIRNMQKINVYKVHNADALVHKITELRQASKHPHAIAALNGDAVDFHGDPTYLIDSPVGFSTREERAILPFVDQYNIIEVK